MLPYTTYHIPETAYNQTGQEGKWLQMVLPAPVDGVQLELLKKITVALKADFDREALVLYPDKDDQILLLPFPDRTYGLVISFGVTPDQFGVWIDLQKPGICRMEKFAVILTLSPEILTNQANAKKELWHCMQDFLESRQS
jgi:hypothetical protein